LIDDDSLFDHFCTIFTKTTNVAAAAQQHSSTMASKQCQKAKTAVPTEIHLLIRAAGDACGNWEKELESVHGHSESEACACVNLVGEYLHKTFS
jgi:hypothetical protein